MKRVTESFGKDKVSVLLVDIGEPGLKKSGDAMVALGKKVLEKLGVDWPNVHLAGGVSAAARMFGVRVFSLMVLDPNGRVRGQQVSYEALEPLLTRLEKGRAATIAATPFGGGTDKLSGDVRVLTQTVRPGDVARIEFEISLSPGWHVYGAKDESGMGTSVKLAKKSEFQLGKVVVPDGERHEIGGFASYWIVSDFKIVAEVKVPANLAPGEHELTGSLNYMACTEEMCDPPGEIPWKVKLRVTR